MYAVLQVLNLITDDNLELLESACHAGLVSRDLCLHAHTVNQTLYLTLLPCHVRFGIEIFPNVSDTLQI